MITAINPYNSPYFTANKYRPIVKCYDEFVSSPKIGKKIFNYSAEHNSRQVKPYTGPKVRNAGFSTETEYGGGYLIADINKPLSTTDIHTCAVLNLVDENSRKNALYHVFHKTSAGKIEEFIRKKFPNFSLVNIIGGDCYQTINTIRKILDAVNNVNSRAPKVFYETVSENPEIVAHNGGIFYMKGKSGKVSFDINSKDYWY